MNTQRANSLTATTWWLLGSSLALDASLVSNQVVLLALIAFSFIAMLIFATPEKRVPALKLYGSLSVSVLLIRLVFRVVFNQSVIGQAVAINLPQISLSLAGQSIHFLGPVAWVSLSAAFTDGIRLSAIILGFALANTVANPRKLLRSTPSALYEIATAAAVAVNLAPQFVVSLRRITRARALRGHGKGLKSFKGLVVPLLEDTVQRSLDLAASMDARGFGRRGSQSPVLANTARAASMIGLVVLAAAIYLLLTSDTPIWVALLLVVLAVFCFYATLKIANSQSTRTRMTLEVRTWKDFAVIAVSVLLVLLLTVSHVPELGLSTLASSILRMASQELGWWSL